MAIVDQVFDRLHSGSDGSASDLLKAMDSCLSLPSGDIVHALQDKEAAGWYDFPPSPSLFLTSYSSFFTFGLTGSLTW